MTDINAGEAARKQFDKQAGLYNNRWASWSDETLQTLLRLADPRPHWRALDIATGTGFTALALAPQVHEVVGTDVSPGMLEQAARRAKETGVRNVAWREARADAQPFPNGYFDLVTCRIAAHHFPRVAAFLQETVRVLRPGGVFVLGDTTVPDDNEEAAFWQNTVEKMRDPSHVRNLTPNEWREACEAAGLEVTDSNMLSGAIPITLSAWLETAGCEGVTAGAVRHQFADAPTSARHAFHIVAEGEDIKFAWPRIVLRALCP